jgi:adenylosuccinate synthase
MNLAIIGAQWGDEGKGKIVDLITPHFDIVVRYQGGHNAGHTVIIRQGEQDQKFVLHLIPSGITHADKVCVIGNGLVVDPSALISEMEELRSKGVVVNPQNLRLSNRAHLILPYHAALDKAIEKSRGSNAVGTTLRGIGPAYEDKIARRGIRAGDLLDIPTLTESLRNNITRANAQLTLLQGEPVDAETIVAQATEWAETLAPHVTDTTYLLGEATRAGKSILFEGAQATMLDIDHGSYPFVTSSNPTIGGICTGAGVPPSAIHTTIGVIKAYTTRVGAGPFPSELPEQEAEAIRQRGGEYGASTGRARRIGWFDAVIARYSSMVNGFSAFALTKLDVLDEEKTINICVGYKINGKTITQVPANIKELAAAEPVYETMPGWQEKTAGINEFNKLPQRAKDYIHRLSELSGAPFAFISTGPERNQTIINKDILNLTASNT